MISEDVVSASISVTHKLLDLLIEFIRLMQNMKRDGDHLPGGSAGKENPPKIKFGEMKFSEYKKMLESGEKMKILPVNAAKMDEVRELSKLMGGRYWEIETGGNNALLCVPEKYFSQMQDVMAVLSQRQLSNNPDSLSVKDGKNLVPDKDMEIVRSVLDYYDIPAFSFRKNEGYMNIVPKEFEGQYEAAMKTAEALKKDLENIEISVFKQDISLADIEDNPVDIMDITSEEAEYLAKAKPCGDMRFIRDENGKTAVEFQISDRDKIESCIKAQKDSIAAAEDYLIKITDKTIGINKDTLLKGENEKEYFTRVPNTGGKDYIYLPKDEIALADGGKSITTVLDFDKNYRIFDENGNFKGERSGRALAESYNTRSVFAKNKPETFNYGNNKIERIELYSEKENKLISMGIDNADTIRRHLSEQGIKGAAADKLLSDIQKELSGEHREKFAFKNEKTDVKFEEVSAEMLRQYALAKRLKVCTSADDNRAEDALGQKVCIIDKSTNKYVLVSPNEDKLREALEKMGYDKLHINAVMTEVQKSHTKQGAVLERENTEVQSFDTLNAEAQEYCYAADDKGIIIIKGDVGSEDASFKYLQIDSSSDRGEIEAALKKGFEIKDTTATASIIECLENKGIITPEKTAVTRDGFEITPVTADVVNIRRNGSELLADKNNISTEALCKKFGIDENQALRLSKTVKRSAEKNNGIYKKDKAKKTVADRSVKKPIQGVERRR